MELARKHTPIDGACHCGNIRFVLLWPDSEPVIPVRKCGCTFCHKHTGSWTSHRSAELVVEINDRSLVSKYNFGTKTADFCVCSVCGVVPLVLSEIDDRQYAVVNVNTFQEIDNFSFSSASADFDGENIKGRLKRRKRNWISNVLLDGSAT